MKSHKAQRARRLSRLPGGLLRRFRQLRIDAELRACNA